jgi:hypothetical protein
VLRAMCRHPPYRRDLHRAPRPSLFEGPLPVPFYFHSMDHSLYLFPLLKPGPALCSMPMVAQLPLVQLQLLLVDFRRAQFHRMAHVAQVSHEPQSQSYILVFQVHATLKQQQQKKPLKAGGPHPAASAECQ